MNLSNGGIHIKRMGDDQSNLKRVLTNGINNLAVGGLRMIMLLVKFDKT